MGGRARRGVFVGITCLLLPCAAAYGAFPEDPPNDPKYAPAEAPGLTTCAEKSVNDEQHYLYSFIPRCSGATDPENASGMSVDKAWKLSPGRPDTVIAYVEGGINWHSEQKELANKVFLNRGELPAPTDPVDDGALNARDYASYRGSATPDSNHNGLVDPEDIIVRFQNGRDEDGNGYTDDISGWDFYDDQNDPATVDHAYEHANNQMRQAGAETDNATTGAGVCAKCMIMPIKAGAEALDRTDDLAQAWLYAADLRADVIVSVTADLGYSSFMRQAIESIWRRGVLMVEASNDFDSLDHQGGMFWPHVIPGNGLVSNTRGVPSAPGANLATNNLTTSFRIRSGQTSWGTHNLFSAATQGGSTSTSTPTLGGVFGLVRSYSKKAAAERLIGSPLTNAEAVQVVRSTALDITDPTPWPGKPGWDLQYGYGRPNVHKAMLAIKDGHIPPAGWIDSPDWYSLHDPTTTSKVPVSGHTEARRSSSYTWRLEFGVGPEPSDGDFITAATGSGSAPRDGALGQLDLSKIPESMWRKKFALSKTKTLETNDQYAVTIRLRVRDAQGRVGEERRAINVVHDPSQRPGFPKRIASGGEAQAQLVDLQGTGHLAAVFGDSNGNVHAVDGIDAKELPGFPVQTQATEVTKGHAGVAPGHEPIVSSVAVGDLDHDGGLDVVATSTTGRTYAWDSEGMLRDGWPKLLRTGVAKPPLPRPGRDYTRDRVQGATAPPVLADLNGDHRLDVVQAAWDGHLYAWDPGGHDLPGFPVRNELPSGFQLKPGHFLINDQKLVTPPAVADLDGDRKPELVLRSQLTQVTGPDIQPGGIATLHAYHADGRRVQGFPVEMPGLVEYYGSAQECITEGSHAPSVADVDGDGKDEIASGPIFSQVYLIGGDGNVKRVYGPVPGASLGVFNGSFNPLEILNGNLPTDTPVTFTASGAFGRFGPGRTLTYAEPGSGVASTAGALLVTGSGLPIKNSLRAYSASSGAPQAGFPAITQGLDFLGAPAVADVDGDGEPDLLEGGDSSALHAFGPGGGQAGGFPKFTSGWVLYAPTVGDLDSDGANDVTALTREGYLSAWKTDGKAAANHEWWSYRHDDRNTARYGEDTRPPGVARSAAFDAGRFLGFRAPGDDWYEGRASEYRLTFNGASATAARRALGSRRVGGVRAAQSGSGASATVKPSGPAGVREHIELPAGTTRVRVQAVDDADNLSRPVTVKTSVAPRQPAAKKKAPAAPSHSQPASGGGGGGGGGGGRLPFTGFLVLALLLAGAVSLAAGRALRERARRAAEPS